ncbi:transposase [Gluconacetobacter sp. 1c LMG 22058]|uniref:Transposase n=1 Tax=Gluconacetobacter dulcium TaxID=2729096 RepID=A0A7W4K3Y9_9PROT|nr:transposase [Gluconacetobacter dulcium]
MFTDDTPLPFLEPGRGRSRTGQLWAYARDDRSIGGTAAPAVVFHATPDRTAAWPARHLVGYCGILLLGAYPAPRALRRPDDQNRQCVRRGER